MYKGGVDSKYDKKLATIKVVSSTNYYVKKNYPDFYNLCRMVGLDLKNIRGVLIPPDAVVKKLVDVMTGITGSSNDDIQKYHHLVRSLAIHLLRDKISRDKVGDKGQIIRTHYKMALKVSEVNSKGNFVVLSGADYKTKTDAVLQDVGGAPTKSGSLNFCVGILKSAIEPTPDYDEELLAKLEGGHMEMVEEADYRGIKLFLAKQFEDQVNMDREMGKQLGKKKSEDEYQKLRAQKYKWIESLDESQKKLEKTKKEEDREKLNKEIADLESKIGYIDPETGYNENEDSELQALKYRSEFGTKNYYIPILAGLMKYADTCGFPNDAKLIADNMYPSAAATFYTLLRPHSENQLISTQLIEKWCGAPYYPKKIKNNAPDFQECFDKFCEKYRSPLKVREKITVSKEKSFLVKNLYTMQYNESDGSYKLWRDYTAWKIGSIEEKNGLEGVIKYINTCDQTQMKVPFADTKWNEDINAYNQKSDFRKFVMGGYFLAQHMNVKTYVGTPCMSKYLCSFLKLNCDAWEKEEKKDEEAEVEDEVETA